VVAEVCRWSSVVADVVVNRSVLDLVSSPSFVSRVLACSGSLGSVDEERLGLCCQLVQLDLERVGVVVDQAAKWAPVLLGGWPAPDFVPPQSAARLCVVHALTVPRRTADPVLIGLARFKVVGLAR
jgi:hypothetical protein